ncbi:MAG: hypothetical protein ORN29_09800, partial [Rhodoferax sp.]|nr:hypothetical protein [Rhodoferax sp.]
MASQGPPATAWRAGQAHSEGAVLALLLGCAAVTVLLYGHYQPDSPYLLLVAGAFVISSAVVLAVARESAASQVTLRWDGECWHITDANGTEVHELRKVLCPLDLQRWVLLHVECNDGSRMWLWLKSPTMNGTWRAMRRAIAA